MRYMYKIPYHKKQHITTVIKRMEWRWVLLEEQNQIAGVGRTFSSPPLIANRYCKEFMTISEFEIKRYEKIVGQFIEKRRPPAHVRNQVDLAFRIEGQSVIIFEIRENGALGEKTAAKPPLQLKNYGLSSYNAIYKNNNI